MPSILSDSLRTLCAGVVVEHVAKEALRELPLELETLCQEELTKRLVLRPPRLCNEQIHCVLERRPQTNGFQCLVRWKSPNFPDTWFPVHKLEKLEAYRVFLAEEAERLGLKPPPPVANPPSKKQKTK